MLRNSPFGEWVNVFYDPSKIDTDTILQLIKRRDCPRAQHITSSKNPVLNPIISAGEPIQIKVELDQPSEIKNAKLPKGWSVNSRKQLRSGTNIITVTTPKKMSMGNETFMLEMANGTKVNASVAVVQQVGKH